MQLSRRSGLSRSFRLLLVEQNPDDAALARKRLAGQPDYSFEVLHVTRLSDAINTLEKLRVDAAIVDLNLPDSTGIETLRRLRDRWPDVAVVVLTGDATEDLRSMALREGALDFLGKSDLTSPLLARTFSHVLERLRAQQSQRQIEALLSANPDAVVVTDADGVVALVNDAALALFGKARESFVGHALGLPIAVGKVSEIEFKLRGQTRTADMRVVHCEWDRKPAFLVSIRDITEQKRLGEQLRQAQKMQAIGLLAGGIAHDFNNLLLVMLIYAEMVCNSLNDGDTRRKDMQEIIDSIGRAQALTRQLLAFSSRQPVDARVIDLNAIVDGVHNLLRRTLPANIEVLTERCADLWPVLADPGQLEQVLLNLAVNARDAMPHGGRFTIATANMGLAEPCGPLVPGDYIAVRVSDTGCGIKPEHLGRIFEPFFTTKDFGKGTGLGLATSYGIARQSGGDLWVESAEGAGTMFTILLPRARRAVSDDAPPLDQRGQQKGAETILLVEDDLAVRRSTSRILRENGYSVVEAASGKDARDVIEHHRPIDFVVTDAMMPDGTGRELAEHLAVDYPRLKILFMTGQTDDHVINNGFGKKNRYRRVLLKPFPPRKLLDTIREMLDA
jgi:two-component system, cell cycle sensor histidine kinase and response regulator CckA